MKKESEQAFICVLKTGRLFDHDIASDALKENGIPFYKQMETSSGLRLAMPFQPAMGPGIYYNIFVPAMLSEEAKQVLNNLPIDVTTDPDIWRFGTDDNTKKGWKIFVWFILWIIALILMINVVQCMIMTE